MSLVKRDIVDVADIGTASNTVDCFLRSRFEVIRNRRNTSTKVEEIRTISKTVVYFLKPSNSEEQTRYKHKSRGHWNCFKDGVFF